METEKKVKIKKALKVKETFDPGLVEVIRRSIAPDLMDSEMKVFLGVCRRYKADPIMKDIVPVVFNTKKGRILNFIITRNFCLKVAHKSKELAGLSSKIVRNDKGDILGALAVCWRKGCDKPFETEVDFKEYYNERNELWGKFPGAMIKKVAEVIVLKMAFGIDMVSDVELEKNGGSMVHIADIEIPKTAFTVSNKGEVSTKEIETKGEKVL